MSILHVALTLDDNVGMRFEQADQLVWCGYLFAVMTRRWVCSMIVSINGR